MNTTPAVIVNKSGFLSSVARGLFGTLMVIIVCATAAGVYGLRVVDGQARSITQQVFAALPQWQQSLPPALSDAFNDRRAPEYRREVEITARLASNDEDCWGRTVVVEATNRGTETVSVLAVRLTIEDERQVPRGETLLYIATPLTGGCEWRGPLMPGSPPRRIAECIPTKVSGGRVTVEVTDLRVSRVDETTQLPPPALRPPEPPAPAPAAPPPTEPDEEPAGEPR